MRDFPSSCTPSGSPPHPCSPSRHQRAQATRHELAFDLPRGSRLGRINQCFTGTVLYSTIGETRTEADFAQHILNTVASDPTAQWLFVVDQLNTHKSEALVRLVHKYGKLDTDLGVKGKHGILKSMNTRREFLEDVSHQIRFQFTPRHCSWMNQVEIWFSILARRVLKRGSFTSLDDLKSKLNSFINYFNTTLAKPFSWTYTGKPLKA
ncbi:MAG: IS630 family transposase [Myxococcales bacterium]|nr:IS630 family transposase [Myxococcales bacterium]